MPTPEKLIMLVVEEHPHYALLLQRAFTRTGLNLKTHNCTNGSDAMDYLKGSKHYSARDLYPFPRVLITNLEMKGCTGFDLLQWLQSHPECNLIPKIVLTSQSDDAHVAQAYRLGANCCFAKPETFEELCTVVDLVRQFWLAALIPPLPEKC